MRRFLPIALAASAPAILVLAFLIGSTPDEEEFPWGILSSFLHVRALAGGSFGTWSSTLGFGMPQPMVPNFDLHPLAPLLLVVSPVTWARLLLATQTIVGATGMWQLGRLLQLSPIVRAVCVFAFLFATPTQNYTLSDFWPSHYVMWTASPWLLLLALRTVQASGRQQRWWAVLLGVAAGVVLASTHPGHAAVYAVVVVAFVAAEWRAVVARWRWLLLAALMAAAIAGPAIVPLALERQVFDPNLGVVKSPEPLPPSAAWDLFARPFTPSNEPWQTALLNRGTRVAFFGGPFAVLALVGLAREWRRHAALALGVVMAAVLVFTPVLPLTAVSRFHFRDPLILCAIPLAGLAVGDLLRRRRGRSPAHIILAIQVAVVLVAALPFLDRVWDREGREARQFHGATGDTPAVDALLAAMREPGRLAYSAQIDFEVAQLEHNEDGLGRNALVYRGVPVVNGTFKAISNDVLSPDDRLFYGRIRVPPQVVASDAALDLLGIRYVLANPGEAVADGLHPVGAIRKSDGRSAQLYDNPDASPGAFLLSAGSTPLPALAIYPECAHDRLLCKDLAPLAALRRAERLDIMRAGSSIRIDVDPVEDARIVAVADMFRSGWTATRDGGGALETFSLGPGLLAVRAPAGVRSIQLDYGAPALVASTILAWLVLASGLVLLAGHHKI